MSIRTGPWHWNREGSPPLRLQGANCRLAFSGPRSEQNTGQCRIIGEFPMSIRAQRRRLAEWATRTPSPHLSLTSPRISGQWRQDRENLTSEPRASPPAHTAHRSLEVCRMVSSICSPSDARVTPNGWDRRGWADLYGIGTAQAHISKGCGHWRGSQ